MKIAEKIRESWGTWARKVVSAAFVALAVLGLFAGAPAFAGTTSDGDGHECTVTTTDDSGNVTNTQKLSTSILDCRKLGGDNGIFYLLSIAISVLTFGIGAAATLGFIISGYQYITARDNTAQIVKAKNRMVQIVIGLAIYALFWVIVNFLIPGGILNSM